MSPTKNDSATDGPLTLHFDDVTRVAGETLQGRVDLNLQLAQDEKLEHLRIKFCGAIPTEIIQPTGQTTMVFQQKVNLFHEKVPLWDQGAVYPEPGSHVLTFPFEFQLPVDLPPSFHLNDKYRLNKGAIAYWVEAVGERPGRLRSNIRVRRTFAVVPPASSSQLMTEQLLKVGWTGGWQTLAKEEKLRRGIWGDYAHARVKFSMPDLQSFPISTPIPFSVVIETDTKPMSESDSNGPADKHGEPLFPAPPALWADLTFNLRRHTKLIAQKQKRKVDEDFRLLDPAAPAPTPVQHEVIAPVWIPDGGHKGKGVWRRAIKFESAVTLSYAPTWRTDTLEWEYHLHFIVPFPGIGNDLKLEIPIRLDPATASPETPARANWPPAMADLPPAYWAGDYEDWGSGDKKD